MTNHPAELWRTRLRTALLAARKDRDAVRVSALRSALSAIDNAEAVPPATPVDAPSSGTIAGGVVGLGAAEAARRALSDEQIRAVMRTEIDERETAAAEVAAGGHVRHAATLREEAAVLSHLLGDV